MTSAVLFAILSGVCAATWTICLKLGSTRINAALGAMRVTASFIIGGTSTVCVLLGGFLVLQEPLDVGTGAGDRLIVSGTLLLQAQGG